jgi:hypothetical protein
MADDDADGFLPQGCPEDEAGVHISSGNASFTGQFEVFEAISLVEIQDAKDLIWKVGDERLDI